MIVHLTRTLGKRRFYSGSTEIFFQALQKWSTPKQSNVLHRIREKLPVRSHLRSIVWNHRQSPSELSRHDVKAIRMASRTSDIPKGDKRMPDSFIEVVLPFRSDADLKAEYLSIHGGLRFGKILEDLDALAGSIAYLYCDDAEVTLVTAAVDRVEVLQSFDQISDVRLRGFVTFVGRSSIEITMAVEMRGEEGSATWDFAALAKFLFVARTIDGKEAVPVPRLILETNGEQELFGIGEARHQYRLRRNETSLFQCPPTEEESKLLHSILVSPPNNATVMKNTLHTTMKICHPQERNVHGFMFGGYLMREAYELAYTTALLHTKGRPVVTKTVDDINFVHPVPIGSLLEFTATIIYTCRDGDERSLLHVEVIADVIDPGAGSKQTTNTFHFNFSSPKDTPPIIPETYKEAMKYLEGKRRVHLRHN